MTDFEEILTEVNAVEQMIHQLHMGLIARLLEQRQTIADNPPPAPVFTAELIGACRIIANYKDIPKGSIVEVSDVFYNRARLIAVTVLTLAGASPNDTDKKDQSGTDSRVLRFQHPEAAPGYNSDRLDAEQPNQAGSRDWRDEERKPTAPSPDDAKR